MSQLAVSMFYFPLSNCSIFSTISISAHSGHSRSPISQLCSVLYGIFSQSHTSFLLSPLSSLASGFFNCHVFCLLIGSQIDGDFMTHSVSQSPRQSRFVVTLRRFLPLISEHEKHKKTVSSTFLRNYAENTDF